MRKFRLGIHFSVFFMMAAFFAVSCSERQLADTSGPPVLADITGEQLMDTIASHKNKHPVLVNFWATWCQPCVEEFPHLVALEKEYGNKVRFIFVSFDFEESRDRAVQFLKDQGRGGLSFINVEGEQEFLEDMPETWSGALPFTMVYGKMGILKDAMEGMQKEADFRKSIERVL